LKQPQGSRIGRLLLLGYLAFVVYASLYPIARFRAPERSPLTLLFEPSRISRSDALTNILVYLPLGWLLVLRLPGLGWFRAGLFGCVLSLAIEYLQAYLPGRVPSLLDWTLNTAGALLGAVLASRLTHFPWPSLERVLPAGRRARLGLAVVGTWAAAQLFPFVPSADLGSLRAGLRPLWHVLRGQTSFSLAQATVYALAAIALAPILAQCLRPEVRARLVVPVVLMGILLAKVPVITRQLSLEALVGALAGLAIWMLLSQSRSEETVSLLAAAAVVVVGGLQSEGMGWRTVPFNWIPFRNHLTNEIVGASDIFSGAWPFLALAFFVSAWRSIEPRRAALLGAAAVVAGSTAIEWAQRFLPGRSPDVTDVVVALGAWLLPWVAISGSGCATGPTPAREDRSRSGEPPSRRSGPR
jgi:VanZ family protein